MKAYDLINKVEHDVTINDLINLMRNNRQVEFTLKEKETDDSDYSNEEIKENEEIEKNAGEDAVGKKGLGNSNATRKKIINIKKKK